MKLTYRLFLVVIVGLLPLIGVQAYNAYDLHQVRRAEVEQLAVRQAQLASSELDRLIEGIRGILRTIAQSRSIREADAAQCARFLERLLPEIPYLTSVAYADAGGTILCSSSPGSGSIADRN